MKKVLSIILIFIFLFSFTGCKDKEDLTSQVSIPENVSKEETVNNTSNENNLDDSETESQPQQDEEIVSSETNTSSKPQNSSVPTSGKPIGGNDGTNGNSSSQENSNSSSGKDNTVSPPVNQGGISGEGEEDTSKEPTDTQNPNAGNDNSGEKDNNPNDTKVCQHKNEKSKYFAPSCTVDGYYEYICQDCGNVRLENLPAKHIFMEYICTECGIADKDNAVLAVNYWVEKNGKRKDDSPDKPYEYVFEKDEIKYIISSFKGELTISFLNSALSEKIDIIIYDSEKCNISYISYGVWGSSDLKKEDISMGNTSIWNNFPLGSGNQKEIEECRKTLKNAVYNIFNFFNDNLFEKILKISLADLGFTNFSQNPADLIVQ